MRAAIALVGVVEVRVGVEMEDLDGSVMSRDGPQDRKRDGVVAAQQDRRRALGEAGGHRSFDPPVVS